MYRKSVDIQFIVKRLSSGKEMKNEKDSHSSDVSKFNYYYGTIK